MKKSKNWGGRRPSAGRKIRLNLRFKPEAAKSLHLLTKHRRALLGKPELTEEDVVSDLVEREWREVEAEYTKGAEVAQENIL